MKIFKPFSDLHEGVADFKQELDSVEDEHTHSLKVYEGVFTMGAAACMAAGFYFGIQSIEYDAHTIRHVASSNSSNVIEVGSVAINTGLVMPLEAYSVFTGMELAGLSLAVRRRISKDL